MKTKRLGLPFLFGALALLLLGWMSVTTEPVAASSAVSAIYFDPPLYEVQVGDKFTVTVRTDMGELHNVMQILLDWDENYIQLDGNNSYAFNNLCTGCSYPHRELRLFGPADYNNIHIEAGQAFGVYSADSFIGNSTVAQLVFRAVAPTNGTRSVLGFVAGNPAPGVQSGTIFANSDSVARAFNSYGALNVDIAVSDEIELSVTGGIQNFQLSWSQTSPFGSDFSHYRLYRAEADDAEQLLADNLTNASYTDDDPNLQPSTIYCYRVEAVNAAGQVIGQSNQACQRFGVLQVVGARQTVTPGATDIPVLFKLLNGTGLCISALDLEFLYDVNVVQATRQVSQTTYTQEYAFRANPDDPGKVKITAITGQCRNLSGNGGIFNVYFDTVGQVGDETRIDIVEGITNTVIYDEDNLSVPVPIEVVDGLLTIGVEFIRGDCNGDGFVNGVDALVALQVSNGTTIATVEQTYACDSNGDGVVNSADAPLIQCFVVESDWNACEINIARHTAASPAPAQVTISGDYNGSHIPTTTVRVTLSDAADFSGGDFTINYDPNEVTLLNVRSTDLTENFLIDTNTAQAGLARISLANFAPIGTTDGVVLELEFEKHSCNSTPYAMQMSGAHLADQYGRDFENRLSRDVEIAHQSLPTCVPTAVGLSGFSTTLHAPITLLAVLVGTLTLIAVAMRRSEGETNV